MKKTSLAFGVIALQLLTACAPIKTPITSQYTLDAFSTHNEVRKKSGRSLLISPPEAMAGYQTEQMLYIQKPFELSPFAHSAWVSPPATMLYPLIIQTLQKTGYFHAIAAGPYSDKADYRLDTQLIELKQNFLSKPSTIQLVVKVTLTRVVDNHVLASRLINEQVCAPTETPYGGVIAANQAAQAFTAKLARFVMKSIERPRGAQE